MPATVPPSTATSAILNRLSHRSSAIAAEDNGGPATATSEAPGRLGGSAAQVLSQARGKYQAARSRPLRGVGWSPAAPQPSGKTRSPGAGASGHDGRARPPPRPARRQLWRAGRRWLRRPAAAGPATGSCSGGYPQAAAVSTRTPPSGRPGHSSASTAGTGHRRGRLVGRSRTGPQPAADSAADEPATPGRCDRLHCCGSPGRRPAVRPGRLRWSTGPGRRGRADTACRPARTPDTPSGHPQSPEHLAQRTLATTAWSRMTPRQRRRPASSRPGIQTVAAPASPASAMRDPAALAACQHAAGWRLRRTCRSGSFPHRSSRPGDGPPRRQEDAMSVFQPDTESGQPTARDLPAFQVVRRGYDPTQADAYIPQLIARLEDAERARVELQREVASLREQVPPTFEQLGAEAAAVLQEAGRSGEQLVEKARRRAEVIVEGAQQQAEQIRADVTSKAQAVMAEATGAAEQVRQDVEQERAALYAETQEVREFRDGLLENLGRVHGDISALLERSEE